MLDVRSAPVARALAGALALGGYAFAITLLAVGFGNGQWPFPGGDVVDYYARAGDALRTGGQVYGGSPGFFYGPPWTVAFGAVGFFGPGVIHSIILGLDGVALWVIAGGDWRRLGWILWFPLIPFELAAGQLNLVVAAAIVAAQRGSTWALAAMALAKVWPVLALPRRYWRSFLVAAVAFSIVSLPWLSLWPGWVDALLSRLPHPLGPVVPVPFVFRAVAAAGLLALQRPWSRALAACIASPDLYWGQLVVLVAPAVLLFGHGTAEQPAGQTSGSAPGSGRRPQSTIGTAAHPGLARE
jgi:hypothetical protein